MAIERTLSPAISNSSSSSGVSSVFSTSGEGPMIGEWADGLATTSSAQESAGSAQIPAASQDAVPGQDVSVQGAEPHGPAATEQVTVTSTPDDPPSYTFWFGPAPTADPMTGKLPASVLARINPSVNIESAQQIVNRLTNPPDYLYNPERTTVTLNIIWAIGVIGGEHFESSCLAERLFLRPDSAFRRDTLSAGLPGVIFNWLLNEPEEDELKLTVDQLRVSRPA